MEPKVCGGVRLERAQDNGLGRLGSGKGGGQGARSDLGCVGMR